MIANQPFINSKNLSRNLRYLYWSMRLGMALIWLWAAIVSWFIYPKKESLDWLSRLGLTYQTHFFFAAACGVDLLFGIASLLCASRKLWLAQAIVVIFYSLAIVIGLPEFLFHPFEPLVKNIAVLGCISYLILMEKS